MTPNSTLQINLAAIDANLRVFRHTLPNDTAICAVVKASAYGLGAVPVAKRLSAAGIDLLAVYSPTEARELADAGIPTPVLILQPVDQIFRTDSLYRSAVSGRLQLSIHSPDQLAAVEQIGMTFGTAIPIHIELDTGMARLGMDAHDASQILQKLPAMRYVTLAGFYSHPTSADINPVTTQRQFDDLIKFTGAHGSLLPADTRVHFANTRAALRSNDYHLDMIRTGLGLFGYGDEQSPVTLAPAVRWLSHITHVRHVPSSTPVGYHGTFTTWRDSRLGVVPIGHRDGYPVSLSNRGITRVGQDLHEAPVRGEVNMDQVIIDLTDCPDSVTLGSPVEIYADDPAAPNAVPAMARAARTNAYELLARLGAHVPRKHTTQTDTPETFPRLAGV